MIHIICGKEAAKNLEAAFELDENLRGELVVLNDRLSYGPLRSEAEESHDSLRSSYWQKMVAQPELRYNDEEVLKQTIEKALQDEEPLCLWMAPNANDVCAYFWLLTYTRPYPSLLHTIFINGLPFLNEKGQLFYPHSFTEVPPREFVKTKRLLREVSVAEYEVDGDEWQRLQDEHSMLRLYEGGKKITSQSNEKFDTPLMNSISSEFQKASKVLNEALKKIKEPCEASFLENRLRELIPLFSVETRGDINKSLRDFEIRIPSAESSAVTDESASIQ